MTAKHWGTVAAATILGLGLAAIAFVGYLERPPPPRGAYEFHLIKHVELTGFEAALTDRPAGWAIVLVCNRDTGECYLRIVTDRPH